MPMLEINQIHHICASVRRDEITAAQVDQYGAFIHASTGGVVDKALNYVFSKDRDFQDFLKTPQAKQVASALRVRKGPITSNWEANSNNRWTVPVGGGVGRIVHFGKLPVNTYAQFFRNVERPDGTTSWSARFDMTFLFPKKR